MSTYLPPKRRALEVYSTALQLVPHREFTFAKLWVLTAQLEIRRKNLAGYVPNSRHCHPIYPRPTFIFPSLCIRQHSFLSSQ